MPAAFNHIVGLKPTIGRIGTAGLVPAVRRADCVSVFALTVDDAGLVAACLEGGDDGTTRTPRWVPGPAARPVVGVPADIKLTTHARAQLDAAMDLLGGLGVRFRDVDVQPLLDAGALLYGGPLVAERTAAVGAFLADASNVTNDVVRSIVLSGDDYLAADAYRVEYELDIVRRAFAETCRGVTCLLLPTVPDLVTVEEVAAEPLEANRRLGTYTTFANLLDVFAIAVPLGIGVGGPMSVQLVGVGLVRPRHRIARRPSAARRRRPARRDGSPGARAPGPPAGRYAVGRRRRPSQRAAAQPPADLTRRAAGGDHHHGTGLPSPCPRHHAPQAGPGSRRRGGRRDRRRGLGPRRRRIRELRRRGSFAVVHRHRRTGRRHLGQGLPGRTVGPCGCADITAHGGWIAYRTAT